MARQYEYKFVSVKIYFTFQAQKFREAYQEEIRRQAEDGWRFVQAFTPGIGPVGFAGFADLIFEREVNS